MAKPKKDLAGLSPDTQDFVERFVLDDQNGKGRRLRYLCWLSLIIMGGPLGSFVSGFFAHNGTTAHVAQGCVFGAALLFFLFSFIRYRRYVGPKRREVIRRMRVHEGLPAEAS